MKYLLLPVILLGCSDHVYTHYSESSDGGAMNMGGAIESSSGGSKSKPSGGSNGEAGSLTVEDSSGGDSSGGASSGGDSSGGASSGGAPPTPSCDSTVRFKCGTITTIIDDANHVYCFDVDGANSSKGNLIITSGKCDVTLDGEYHDISKGIPDGLLKIYGCVAQFNCY